MEYNEQQLLVMLPRRSSLCTSSLPVTLDTQNIRTEYIRGLQQNPAVLTRCTFDWSGDKGNQLSYMMWTEIQLQLCRRVTDCKHTWTHSMSWWADGKTNVSLSLLSGIIIDWIKLSEAVLVPGFVLISVLDHVFLWTQRPVTRAAAERPALAPAASRLLCQDEG